VTAAEAGAGGGVVRVADLPRGQTAWLFEGADHGAEVSIFVVDAAPGGGPGLHVHPYAETFLVHDGESTFTVGERTVLARGGQMVVVPAGVPHRYQNRAEARLRMTTVHPSPRVVQRWVDDT
jgi:quercetin dioxygenase-like cupin family protein